MNTASLVLVLLGHSAGWNATYFPNVQLHRGSPRVTIQVAWLQPATGRASDTSMPAMVSIFENHRLASSTKIGSVPWFWPPEKGASHGEGPEFSTDPESGEGILVLPMMGTRKDGSGPVITTAVYIFKSNSPRRALFGFGIYADEKNPGEFRESMNASEVGFAAPKGHYPDPKVIRKLKFSAKTRTFLPTRWVETPFEPTSLVLRGKSGMHSYLIRLRSRNFQLGHRHVSAFNNHLHVGGLVAYGNDMVTPGELKGQDMRTLFMSELTSFRAWIDGKEISIPTSLWKTCFDLHWGRTDHTRVTIHGQDMRLSLYGSDGGGSYGVCWRLRANGKSTRRIEYLD